MSRREEKIRQLKLAIHRVETGRGHHVKKGAKLNVSTAALEAQIDPSTIHTRYPEIAELIREKTGKATRVQRDMKQAELKKCRERNRELIAELASLRQSLVSVTSQYATVVIRIKQLEASGSKIEAPIS